MELESFLQNELQVRPTLRSLRKGYTTGASAAAATKAAMQALLDGGFPERVAITLPTGRTAMFRIEEPPSRQDLLVAQFARMPGMIPM